MSATLFMNYKGYLIFAGVVVIGGILLYAFHPHSSPSVIDPNTSGNSLAPANQTATQDSNQTPSTTQENTDLGNSIAAKLKTQFPTGSYEWGFNIGEVSVTQNSDGSNNVQVDINTLFPYVDTRYGAGSNADISQAMAHIYVTLYRDNTMNLENVSITAHYPPAQDQYGNPVSLPATTTSLSKSEASKYNWSLDEASLDMLVSHHLLSKLQGTGN